MDDLAQAVERLDRLKLFADISFDRRGGALAAAIRPAAREPGESYTSRIWHFELNSAATQLTHGPNGDYLPRFSPTDDRLAFTSDRTTKGKADLFILEGPEARPLGDIPGTIEDLRWTRDGRALIVLAADRGLDGAATNGAKRLTWGEAEDPVVDNPSAASRRLFKVDVASGATTEVGPAGLSVWEFDLLGADAAVALVSDDPSERGWYHSDLVSIDFASRSIKVLHRTPWQMQGPAASPGGKRVAFAESWSSDRGLVAGEISVLNLASAEISALTPGGMSNITSLGWRDDESIWFAGWSRLGSVYGLVRLDGVVEWMTREDAVIGSNSFSAGISPAPDKEGFAAVRETEQQPPEIVFKAASDAAWSPVTSLNADAADDYPGYPDVLPIAWKGATGLGMEGLVLLPRAGNAGPRPTIVDIHGGPSWAAKHAFNPGSALPFVAAGYVVFLPNYRGNVGWGKDFGTLNIGDPAGAEFEDILLGIDHCVAAGLADPDRLGVTGASYGGYMTAWAVATTDRFKAAVMVSGICNQLSSHYSCNHHFHEFISGGTLKEERYRKVALDRSPLLRLDKPTTPTLILHGSEDRCTPLGQAQEFHAALLERGVKSELVVYPREGHGFQERGHRLDAWQRTASWFDRHIGKKR
jgi:dipeptidyl aminopeptidase/acylaminoacyl peptidase